MYADWLEDHGESERAELIRVQCRLAGLAAYELEYEELKERELDLLGRHGQEWSRGLPAWARREPHRFVRGFVGHVFLTAHQFLKSGEGLFRAAPIERVVLRNARGMISDLAACPLLGRLVSLGLPVGGLDAAQLGLLLASPHLGSLRGLDLSYNPLAGAGECLARWPKLARIRRLNLRRTGFADADLAALLASPYLGELEELELEECPVGDEGARLLAGCSRLSSLRVLRLTAAVGDEGAAALAGSPYLGGLQELRITDLEERMASAVMGAPWLASLRRLELCDVRISETAAKRIGSLPGLRSLSMMQTPFREGPMSAFFRAPWGKELCSLELPLHSLTREIVATLVSSKQASQLVRLDLSGPHFYSRIGLEDVWLLVQSPGLSGLRELCLRHCLSFEDAGQALASLPELRRLRRLDLSGCRFTRESCLALLRSPHLAGLRCLDLSQNMQVGPALADLGGALPFAALSQLWVQRCGFNAESVQALVRSRAGETLRVLDLSYNPIGPEGAQTLLSEPHLKLASLDVRDAGLDANTRRALTQHFGLGVLQC